MADPFEVRMRFTSQLQYLNASTASAIKAANFALKYAEFSDDLHSCILEQLLLPFPSGAWCIHPLEENSIRTRSAVVASIGAHLEPPLGTSVALALASHACDKNQLNIYEGFGAGLST